jgi:hypothetical protein
LFSFKPVCGGTFLSFSLPLPKVPPAFNENTGKFTELSFTVGNVVVFVKEILPSFP